MGINTLNWLQAGSLSLLVVIISWWAWQQAVANSPKQIRNKLKWPDLVIISTLSLLFASLATINLASRQPPQGRWLAIHAGQRLTLTFHQATYIHSIKYYTGLANGVLEVHGQMENGQELLIESINFASKTPPLNTWISSQLTPAPKLRQIWFTARKAIVQLRQIAIYDQHNHYINAIIIEASQPHAPLDKLQQLVTAAEPTDTFFTWRSSTTFDEVYYTSTAQQFLLGIYPYVDVHPPLGSLLISLGIACFGMNPFGWRIIPLLCGILLVPLVYLFSRQLSNSRWTATVASSLIVCDCMHFVISRLAIIESQVTLFIIAVYWLFYNYLLARRQHSFARSSKYLLGCAWLLAAACACKWTALYCLPLLIGGIIYQEFWRNHACWQQFRSVSVYLLLTLIILPACLYTLSYLPYLQSTHDISLLALVSNLQTKAWLFHTKLVAGVYNGFESSWWSWPLLLHPYSIYYQLNSLTQQAVSLVLIGNPAIWWFAGLASLLLVIRQFSQPRWQEIYLLLALSCQYLPYALFTRASYIYYFYSATPLVVLVISLNLQHGWHRQESSLKWLILIYVTLVVILFAVFFPALAGLPLARSYVFKYLLWFPNWQF